MKSPQKDPVFTRAIDEIPLLTLLTKNKKSATTDAAYEKKTRRINRRVFPYPIEIA